MKNIEFDLAKVKDILNGEFIDPFLNKELSSFIVGNSKFIRSKLALLYLRAQVCEITPLTYEILSIGELIHDSSLLHDDVLDNAELRRGKETISNIFGDKVSILAGDYLLCYAIEKLLKFDNKKFIEIFKNCTKQMCEAEFKQYFNRGVVLTEDEYLMICRGKTAKLFSVILESVSTLHGLNVESAVRFGDLFGLCFQIKNDLEPKSMNQDIKNKIYTAKDILGIEKTNDLLDNYKEEMREILSKFSDNVYKQSLEDLIKNL